MEMRRTRSFHLEANQTPFDWLQPDATLLTSHHPPGVLLPTMPLPMAMAGTQRPLMGFFVLYLLNKRN